MNKVNRQSGLVILGLGTGEKELLTRKAWSWLRKAARIAVRAGVGLPIDVPPESQLVELNEDVGVEGMADQLLDLARQPEGVTYAAPGDPLDTDPLARTARQKALAEKLWVELIPGVSLVAAARAVSGTGEDRPAVTVAAGDLAGLHMPPFPPSLPIFMSGIDNEKTAAESARVLGSVYPVDALVQEIQPGKHLTIERTLAELDRPRIFDPFAVWYIPGMGEGTSIEDFQEIVAHLRAPNGCPWDREQTHLSLRKHLLEETYETLEALDDEDIPGMVEEFGDLLLQIVLHAQIASEGGEFRLAEVIQGIYDKIVRRHPHVFGEVEVEGVRGVLQNWERLKAMERGEKNRPTHKGLLDGVPPVFPSLAQAQEIQDRAARVGFDWPDIDGVEAKVEEELAEVKSAPDLPALTAEIGDLLFAVVNLARWEKVDAEFALRETNARFRRRFAYIERSAEAKNIPVDTLGFDELNRLWDEAKRSDHHRDGGNSGSETEF